MAEPDAAVSSPGSRAAKSDPDFVDALARGLRVLESFSPTDPALGLSQLSRKSGLGKRTTYRLARTLQILGYLTQDPLTKVYRPSLRALDLGFAVLESLELRERARPSLDDLARGTNEFVSLAVLDGMQIVMVETIKPSGITVGVQTYAGWRDPAHVSSHGKVLLAWLPEAELDERYPDRRLQARTESSITTLAGLKRQLAEIRRRGYAINDQESSVGVRSVAAPIRDRASTVVGSVNLAVPTARASRERLETEYAPMVLVCAGRVSQALGHEDATATPGSR